MSDELVVIPRGELERALRVTTTNVRRGFVLVASGLTAMAGAFILAPGNIFEVGLLFVGGVTVAIIGAATLLHAKRASSTIQAKLREQELPPARLLASPRTNHPP